MPTAFDDVLRLLRFQDLLADLDAAAAEQARTRLRATLAAHDTGGGVYFDSGLDHHSPPPLTTTPEREDPQPATKIKYWGTDAGLRPLWRFVSPQPNGEGRRLLAPRSLCATYDTPANPCRFHRAPCVQLGREARLSESHAIAN
ncbi:hypothetical protein [Streptomyces sp. A5-4]|uniref:hypothetical protein n=1 Tax=Streptomyces sp. A5-4 TaxID=3384771 RepID=UPI003DA9812C